MQPKSRCLFEHGAMFARAFVECAKVRALLSQQLLLQVSNDLLERAHLPLDDSHNMSAFAFSRTSTTRTRGRRWLSAIHQRRQVGSRRGEALLGCHLVAQVEDFCKQTLLLLTKACDPIEEECS